MVDPGSEWEDASLIVGVAVRVVALDAYVGEVVSTRAEDRAGGARPEAYAGRTADISAAGNGGSL